MLDLDISFQDIEKKEYVDETKILEFFEFVLKNEREDYNEKELYISILLTDNSNIQVINKEYRDKDMPTDVISFAYNETENFGGVEVIGDIVVSLDRVEEQCKEYNHSVVREFYYVLVHGLLHLLGYDHIEEVDKLKMREKEELYLSKFNITRDI
ncbi:rRNA maturation RNase YbeY [Streptobacillus felis]|uniref:Endoribonuclease YbeY n=2 Tax=Streptobacillus felis TaxID=1384509 RepID=A0A7Z0T734_9FUSO|nr:rRNA maturation RNase YbeY [Streptobacillus felis]NYV27861.1 rRNA maturation RNase YbeY [Streptobacillus felis]